MIHIFFLSLSPNTNDNCCGRSNSSSINWFCIHGILVGRNVCAIAIKCRSRLRCEFQREEGNFTGTIDFYTCDFCGMEMTKPTKKTRDVHRCFPFGFSRSERLFLLYFDFDVYMPRCYANSWNAFDRVCVCGVMCHWHFRGFPSELNRVTMIFSLFLHFIHFYLTPICAAHC